MFSNISPRYYFDEAIFLKEKEQIFKNSWQFFGFTHKLQNNNDFIAHSIAGVPVVVQNLKGEIKAFLNVCSHRFSKIQIEEEGNRALMCPYHGWSYDADGVPAGMPKRPLFKDYTQEELCSLKLKEFKVDTCGGLVFVTINNTNTLKEYLGDFYNELESISNSLGEQVDKNAMGIQANWKVIVENTLESYHVNLIHADSFRKLGAKGLEFAFSNMHSAWDAELTLKREDKANQKIDRLFEGRDYKISGYRHLLIFPNLLVSSTHGTSYNFSYIDPVSPANTIFTSYVFTAQHTDVSSKAMISAFQNILMEFNRTVFAEDKAICEIVQQGVAHTAQQGVLSLEEKRVQHFQEKYIQLIQD